jgi:hypothetical protein
MGMARDDSGRYIHATTYNRDGAAFHLIYDRYAELYSDAKGWGSGTMFKDYLAGGGNVASLDNNNAIALETVNFKSLVLDRYQYPKLIAKGNSRDRFAAYYMAYYDNGTGQLIFRNFRIGETETDVGTSNRRLSNTGSDQTVSTGNPTAYSYNHPHTNLAENIGNYNGIYWDNNEHSFETGRLIVSGGASNHFDMAVTSGDVVVITYYDETAGQLKVKYSDSPVDGMNPTQDINWRDSPVNLPLYTGNYVSMVVDSSNGLHIAAFDAGDSDLKYIFIPDVTQSVYKAVTVDQYGAVGNWTDIKLHPQSGRPYIAYYNATEAGTRESIKMACLKDDVPMWNAVGNVKAGVDKNGYTTGKWESRTVPAFDPPQGGSPKFQKVNLGFTTQTDGYRPVLGYLGTYIEFSYPVGE